MKQSFIAKLSQIGAHPDDSAELKLHKSLLVIGTFIYAIAGIIWGLVYYAFNESTAASIPFWYGVVTLLSLLAFSINKNFRFLRFTQLLFGLLLPFLLMITLHGFVNGSAVVIWSSLTLQGALFYTDPKKTYGWLISYILILVISGLLEPYVQSPNNLTASIQSAFFVFNIGVVTSATYFLIRYLIIQKDETARLLGIERVRSENLLLNILPKQIADILKQEERVIADRFESASILFADLSGFTPLSAEMEPEEMVSMLNSIYSHFDMLVEKYGAEKIRTIGDNYMVAAGVPTPNKDHAQALANFALDVMAYCERLTPRNGKNIEFRIGINSGPLIAGVIGQKKFQYDVWGDTVNVASRMESQGVVGKIQITAATCELLKDEFTCEKRGMLDIKGKGEMETWFLVGRKPEK